MPICHYGGSGILKGLVRRFYKFVIARPKAEAIQETRSRTNFWFSAMTCGWWNLPKYVIAHLLRDLWIASSQAPRNDEKYLLGNHIPKIRARNDGNGHSEGAARRIPLNKRSFAVAQLCIQAHTSSLRCGGSLCMDDTRCHCERSEAIQEKRSRTNLWFSAMTCGWWNVPKYVIAHLLRDLWIASAFGLAMTPRNSFRANVLRQKAAFTLAEVLITLGIIGIVAAMTMPMIVENTKKQQTVVQLKKAYSVLSQAVTLSELENGSCDYWDYTLPVDQFVKKYLTKFLEIRETRVSDSGQNYKYLNGSPCTEALCTEASYVISVADGTNFVVSRYTWLDTGRVVLADVNGDNKPNTLGKDVFALSIQPGPKVAPFGYGKFGTSWDDSSGGDTEFVDQIFGKYDREVLTGDRPYACKKGKRGFWCAALILSDGWEIRDDYPW